LVNGFRYIEYYFMLYVNNLYNSRHVMIAEDKEKKYELLSKYLRSGSVVDDEELFIEFQKDKEFQKWYMRKYLWD